MILMLFVWSPPRVQAQLGDGLFAVFDTTLGSYTAELYYVEAPITVASFVTLAEGSRAWLDLPTGQARTNKFYNGITFHRVISGFVIQGGSPNGQGTDGPGYVFVDEVSNGLSHSEEGYLSMANSGANSNGSQFFVTLGATLNLDGRHSIFGKVVGGQDVVNAIGAVSTDANDKPVNDVVINDITILRNGAAALAFDPSAQNLPIIDNAPINSFSVSTDGLSITYSPTNDALYNLTVTTNLTDFLRIEGPQVSGVTNGDNHIEFDLLTNGVPFEAYSITETYYPTGLHTPASLTNQVLELTFGGGQAGLVLTIFFNNQDGGTYEFFNGATTETNNLVGYVYNQEPIRGRLAPIQYAALVPMIINLATDSPVANRFNGDAFPSGSPQFPIEGTYRFNP